MRHEHEGPNETNRRRRRCAPAWSSAAAVVLAAAVVAACASTGRTNSDASTPGTVATNTRVIVTFDDHGLHASPAAANPGIIEFGFTDHRTRRTGSETLLYYEMRPKVGGDLITGVGGRVRVLLCAHRWFLVVRVDGVAKARIPFDVSGASPLCTTPGT